MPDFVTFDEFYERTASAKYEYHRDVIKWAVRGAEAVAALGVEGVAAQAAVGPVGDDEAEAEFAKMKAFVLRHYEGVRPERTFLDLAGNPFDCIPFDQVPMVRKARSIGHQIQVVPPEPPRYEANATPAAGEGFPTVAMTPPLGRGTADLYGNPVDCPEGCVALRRTGLNRLSLSGKFERFFEKRHGNLLTEPGAREAGPGVVTPAFAGDGHHYATVQDVTGPQTGYAGAATWMNTWDPNPGQFGMTLSQLWIVGGDFSVQSTDPTVNPSVLQTIEGGWMVQPSLQDSRLANPPPPTYAPRLFIYFNPDGYLAAAGVLAWAGGDISSTRTISGSSPTPRIAGSSRRPSIRISSARGAGRRWASG